jgi:peptide/nickel transport system substrate-binding protein
MRKFLVVLACLTLVASGLFAGGGGQQQQQQASGAGEYVRSETVFIFSGMSNTPTDMNPMGVNPNFPVAGISNIMLLYETLFMMNMLTGELEPLVADSYRWVDDLTMEIKINPGVTFNDGRKATSEDVAYSYNLGRKYAINWSTYWNNFESVTATDSATVRIKMKADNPNKLNALDSLQGIPVLPKHVWEKVEADSGNDISRIRRNNNMTNPVGTGSFKLKGYDNQRVILERNDNYWGIGPRFKALPAMKYIMNVAYPDNNALALAFQSNQVDIAQAFIPNIWDMIKSNPKISCYYDDLPYHMPGAFVGIEFNLTKPGLDNVAVRRALAYAINYQQVADSAMSGYSAQLDPMLVLPSEPAYKQYIDHNALAPLKYKYDPNTAKKILDDAGIRDTNNDGIRELNGRPLSFTIQTGDGWTDWNAAAEVVSQGARAVGIEIITETPEGGQFTRNRTTGDYELALTIPGEGIRPSQPWFRYNWTLSDVGLPPMGEVRQSNQTGYSNPRANEILSAIPKETNDARLKELYTEITRIFLQDLPIVPIMYRPFQFYEVNNTYWTGWPHNGDGTNNPPMIDRAAGLKTFFTIQPVK